MGERLIKPYEISVWEERLIQDGAEYKFKEHKLAVIGSNTMTGLNRVYDPIFNKKTNGEKTLTFSLKYKYFDPYSENNEVINPFAALLVNERKIKLYYDNKWYEFVIKDHSESSEDFTWTYTCVDAFVLELSKQGYNLTFDSELQNNQGTAAELGQKVLENTDWQLGEVDTFKQLIAEPIYKAVLINNVNIIKLNNNADVIPTPEANIYVFYSYIKNQNGKFVQFIVRDDNRNYTIDDNNVITDTNFRIIDELEYKVRYIIIENPTGNPQQQGWYELNNTVYSLTSDNEVVNEKIYYQIQDKGFWLNNIQIILLQDIETKYQANRLAYNQLTTYDSVMGRVVDRFNFEDTEVYKYTEYKYTTSNVVMNYITNGENFNILEDGTLQGWNPYTDQSYTYNIVKNPGANNPQEKGWYELIQEEYVLTTDTTIQANKTYYKKEQKPVNKLELITHPKLATGEPLVDLSTFYQVDGYLKVTFNDELKIENGLLCNTLYNSGIENNIDTIQSISKGDKFVFRWKARMGGPTSTLPLNQVRQLRMMVAKYEQDTPTLYGYYYKHIKPEDIIIQFDGTPKEFNNIIKGGQIREETIDGKTIHNYVINSVVQVPSTKYLYEVEGVNYIWNPEIQQFEVANNTNYVPYFYLVGEATKTITANTLNDVNTKIGIFLYTINQDLETITYYLQDIQFTRFIPDGVDPTGQTPVLIGNIPTATSVPIDTYYIKPAKDTAAEDIETFVSIKELAQRMGVLESTITPKYNENSEKTLSITASQSNCFNILQTIAETFECWIDLSVEHDSQGYITTGDNGKLNKFVYLREYAGKDNWTGFKYGINLQSIERTVNSEEIVTKLIVDQAQSDYVDEGYVSIINAPSNSSGESYILNFDYYYNQNLLNRDEVEADKNIFINDISKLNQDLRQLEKERKQLEAALVDLGGKRVVYTQTINEAKETVTQGLAEFESLTGQSYEDYRKEHGILIIPTGSEEQDEANENQQYTEEETLLDLLGTLYTNSAVINNYSGILTNIDQEYWEVRKKLRGSENYTVRFWRIQDDNDEWHVYVDFSDYLTGAGFQLGASEQIYSVSITRKFFDITSNDTTITFILPQGYKFEQEQPWTYAITSPRTISIIALTNDKGVKDLIEDVQNKRTKTINNFNNKYYRFIQEGTWNSTDYIDSELYYLDALQVSNTSAQPQVSYTINVVEVSELEGLEYYQFDAGDKTYIEDTEFFGWSNKNGILTPAREEVIVSEVEWHLEEPESNVITVQNYKTRFEDLFQRISAAVQTVQYNEATYAKISTLLDANGTINQNILLNSLNNISGQRYNLTTDGSISINGNQILIRNLTNPTNRVIINNEGIAVSSDGGNTWRKVIDGFGINAGAVYTGSLNTDKIIIGSTTNPSFRWDKSGISAYKSSGHIIEVDDVETEAYDLQTYVRYDQYGLYGIKNAETFKAQSLEDIKNKAHFAVTWDGFFIKNSYEGGGKVQITSDNDFQVINSDQTEKIKIGALEWEQNGIRSTTPIPGVAPRLYGIRINNNAGEPVFVTDDEGNLHITGEITATSANFGELMTVGKNGDNVPFIAIDGRTAEIYSSNYSEGANVGWIINKDGDAVFNNITARGAIKTAVFEYAEIQAVGGIFLFRPSSTIRKATIASNNTDLILEVEKPQLFIKIVYNKIENPTGNPQDVGWYEHNDYGYRLSQDVSVVSDKEYFERTDAYNSWCKISNYIATGNEPDIAQGILVNNGLAHVYQVINVNLEKKEVTLSGAAVMINGQSPVTTLDELRGGALVDIGRSDGSSNYGIGVNSSDNTVNLPARAISLFETNINTASGSQLKVTYNYRGILGTLPVLTYDGNNPQVNQLYHDYMEGTQGIYTDNMYIGSNDQYIAFYTAINNNVKTKHLKVNVKELTLKAGSFKPYEEDPNQNFIYLSNEDYTKDIANGIQINNSDIKTDWRLIIGKKFGVDKAGNLYADNAVIRGNIQATSGSFGSGAEIINGQFVVNQDSVSGLRSALDESTGYVLTVETNYSNEQNVNLIAHLYYGNTEVTTNKPSSMFRWYRKSETLNYYIVENPTGNPQEKGWYEKISEEQEDTYVLTTDTEVIEGKEYYEYTNIEPLGGAYSIIFDRNTAGYGTTIICRFNDEALLTTPDNYAVETPNNYLLTARV